MASSGVTSLLFFSVVSLLFLKSAAVKELGHQNLEWPLVRASTGTATVANDHTAEVASQAIIKQSSQSESSNIHFEGNSDVVHKQVPRQKLWLRYLRQRHQYHRPHIPTEPSSKYLNVLAINKRDHNIARPSRLKRSGKSPPVLPSGNTTQPPVHTTVAPVHNTTTHTVHSTTVAEVVTLFYRHRDRSQDKTWAFVCMVVLLSFVFLPVLYTRMWTKRYVWDPESLAVEQFEQNTSTIHFSLPKIKDLLKSKLQHLSSIGRRLTRMKRTKRARKAHKIRYSPILEYDLGSASDEEHEVYVR